MKVLIKITHDVAVGAICLKLAQNDGMIKPLNINIFKKIIGNYIFAFGESYTGDHQYDHNRHYHEAVEIVNKYFQ